MIYTLIVKVHHKYFDWDMNRDKPKTLGLSLKELTKYYQKIYPDIANLLPDYLHALNETGVSCSLYASWRDVLSFNQAGPGGTPLSINQFKKAYCDRISIVKRVGNKRYQWDANSMGWNQVLEQ